MQKRKIQEVIRGNTDGTVFLLKVSAADYKTSTVELFKQAADNDRPIIYVATKRPYVHLHDLLKKNHLTEDGVYVVDTITKTITDEGVVDRENVTFLDSPQNLTNVGTAVSLTADRMDADEALLIVDSLSALLTYNTERDVSRFLQDLNDRTDTLSLDLALFKQDQKTAEQIGSTLRSIVDKTVFLSEDETDTVYVLEHDSDHTVIELSADIARALAWDEGDELSFNISGDTLELEKQ